jgi:hypothetical protein
MARKSLQTDDHRHVQFGEVDTVSMPDDFTAPDEGVTCPQWFGRIIEVEQGAAYINRDDTY